MSVTSYQFAVAAHIMTALAHQYGTEIPSSALAASVNADPTFVRKSLSKLAKAGLVKTTRGKYGSCALARPPAEITLRDIYIASEAPAALAVHAYPEEQRCLISAHFKSSLSAVQAEAQRSVEETLAQTTLAGFLAGLHGRVQNCSLTTISLIEEPHDQ